MNNITVVGAGYVGLVTGACFAEKNNKVVIVEKNNKKIESLIAGRIPFYEPGLDELVKKSIKNGKISFTTNLVDAIKESPQLIFSCVGTPSNEDGSANLKYVFTVAKEIGENLNNYCVVVNKSTVPVGTAQKVENIIASELKQRNVSIDFDVVSNPEFLKEGDALNDFLLPDRVVIGTNSERAKKIFLNLYTPFIKDINKIIFMDVTSAELSKYAANTMLATRISFMNQMALLADKVGADIEMVKKGMQYDTRIGKYFLNAGIGYGGSCFPKDIKALIHMGKIYDQPMTLVKEVDTINEVQRLFFTQKIIDFYGDNIIGKKIGIWGLAFKPETDDIRYAPSINVINNLLITGAKIYAYDPIAQENVQKLLNDRICFANSADEVLEKVDALVIITEWKEFITCDIKKFKKLNDKIVFDARNCFCPKQMNELGITYFTIGRNRVVKKQKKNYLYVQKKL